MTTPAALSRDVSSRDVRFRVYSCLTETDTTLALPVHAIAWRG